MSALTENEILDIVYSMYEGDETGWDTTSTEYLTARIYANVAVNMWEKFDNTEWRELWTDLTSASDGDKETETGKYDYDCPGNFMRPGSWVRVGGSMFTIVTPEKVASLIDSDGDWVYFTGSPKAGYKLNFNPKLTINGGAKIEYEYYKTATKFTLTTSTTEMSDPYMIVFYILYRLIKNDGDDYSEERDIYEGKLNDMQAVNMSGYVGINDAIDETLDSSGGFGI